MNPALRRVIGLPTAALLGVFLITPAPATAAGFGGFLENLGQFDDTVRFSTSSSGMAVYFTADGLVLDILDPAARPVDTVDPEDMAAASHEGLLQSPRRAGCVVRVLFDEAAGSPLVTGSGQLPGVFHFLKGSDPADWHTGARLFSEVTYRDVWPGIDLVFRLVPGGLEYDAILRPGADPSRITFRYEGASGVSADPEGGQRLETPMGDVLHRAPGLGGEPGSILQDGLPLVTDSWSPSVMAWCTFLGDAGMDHGWGTNFDEQGLPFVVGITQSLDFPTTPGVYDSTGDATGDAFITKMEDDGTGLVWSTLLGGAAMDGAGCVDFDSDGNVVVGGFTLSQDFPTTPGAFQETGSTPVGDTDTFVAKLSPTGDSLVWSTYLGADSEDTAYDMTMDSQQNVVLVGHTNSPTFPTTPGVIKETLCCGGYRDVFVTKLAADGDSLVWSTLLGADDDHEWGFTIDLDASDHVVIGGATFSPNFPTTAGAYDMSYNGEPDDGFLAKISSDGTWLMWATFLGGGNGDFVAGLEIEPSSGDVLAAARTYSLNFPTTPGAFDRTHNGQADAVVLRLLADGSDLVWSTFVGGYSDYGSYPGDWVDDLAIGPAGSPVIVGSTNSPDYPTTPEAPDPTYNGDFDGFITIVKNDGSDLLWSTFCGGSVFDQLPGEPVSPVTVRDGEVLITGYTQSADFPVGPPGIWDDTFGGSGDAVVVMLRLPPVDAPELPRRPSEGIRLLVSPNPFDAAAEIRFELPAPGPVRVTVHDTAGRLVRPLLSAPVLTAGVHRLTWDGLDGLGRTASAGVYYVRLETQGGRTSQRVVVLR